MRVAILAPGPSLAQTYEPGRHALVLGINRAVLGFKCHWWCFGDWLVFFKGETAESPPRHTLVDLPSLGLFMSGTAHEDGFLRLGMSSLLQVAREWLTFEDIDPARTRDALRWSNYTAAAALMLAAHLGAKEIEVFGADWSDQPDFDGKGMPGNVRHAKRWADELEVWNGVVNHLAERGVTVERILPTWASSTTN